MSGIVKPSSLYITGTLRNTENAVIFKEGGLNNQMVREFLKNEDRAQRVLIEASVATVAVGLIVAVMAI
jgi:hypothetical protein